MVRKADSPTGIQVYSSDVEALVHSPEGVAEEIWSSLSQPSLQDAIQELKIRKLEKELHMATLLILVRKSTDHRLREIEGSKFDASKVVRSLNDAIEANRSDWEEKVA